MYSLRLLLFACLMALSACTTPHSGRIDAPPPASGMVAAAHPLAVEAGLEVLDRGGSAADAAVAVQAALGLVEPQSSGLGGGAFLTYYDRSTRRVITFNGRETAPRSASPDRFLDAYGEPLSRSEAMLGGISIGVPGAVAILHRAHQDHGRLDWADLFAPVSALARAGFPLSGRTVRYTRGDYPQSSAPDVRALFSDEQGRPLEEGALFRNPAYADTLDQIAQAGPAAIYTDGPIRRSILQRANAAPLPGRLTEADFEAYTAPVGEAICAPYQTYQVCVPAPPSSGVAVLQLLAILDETDIAERGPDDPQAWFLFAEASRLAYADRDRYVGDPDHVDVPLNAMLAPDYVAERRALIGEHAMPRPEAGAIDPQIGEDHTLEPAGTTHFVIVDRYGNVASMTATVESYFGSGRVASGFFLNNQLTDFSFRPDQGGRPAANRVAGGKRPRSSMSPTIVLDADGDFVAAVGSPGGNAIIAYVAKSLVGMLAWDLTPQEAIDLPNIYARGAAFRGEADALPAAVTTGLADRGVIVRPGQGEESGLHAVRIIDGVLVGGADRRRDGVARRAGEAAE